MFNMNPYERKWVNVLVTEEVLRTHRGALKNAPAGQQITCFTQPPLTSSTMTNVNLRIGKWVNVWVNAAVMPS